MTTTSGKANTTNGVIPSNMRLNEGEGAFGICLSLVQGKVPYIHYCSACICILPHSV
jgi:hypothetical protein